MKRNYLVNQAMIIALIVFVLLACSKKSNQNPTPNPQKTVPTITSLSTTQGAYNTSVTITGTGFSSTVSDDQVFFNGNAANIAAATATQLTVNVPLSAGTGKVTVSVNNSVAATGPVFTYQPILFSNILAGSDDGAQGSTDGTGTSASFKYPNGLAVDMSGNVYVADYGNNRIRKISPTGLATTLTAASNPADIVIDGTGNLFFTDFNGGAVDKLTPGGVLTTFATGFNQPYGIAIGAAGNLYVADQLNSEIKKITPTGIVTVVAGTALSSFPAAPVNGPAASATFHFPAGVAIDASGNLYVADTNDNMIRKITPGGVVSTLAGSGSAGSADGTGVAASFSGPTGITVDIGGNVYVADKNNHIIRKITPAGVVTTIAGKKGVYGDPDDGPALSITFDFPVAVTLDATGNIYASDAAVVYKLSMQ